MIPRYAPVPRSGGGGGGGVGGSSPASGRPRGLALLVAVLALTALVLGTGSVVRPLWWRLKADLSEHEHHRGSGGAGGGKPPTTPPTLQTADLMMRGSRRGGEGSVKAVRMDNRAGEVPKAVAAAEAAAAALSADGGGGGEADKAAGAEGVAKADAAADAAAAAAAADAAPPKAMDEAAREALRERLAKMTPEQLERAREQAREQQWDDAWWQQYQKVEAERREKEKAVQVEAERRTVARFNLTLTEEAARSLSHPDGGYVFVTWANSHYTDFALSWAHHLRKAGLGNHLVIGAMDDAVLYSLAKRKIPVFAMQSGLTEGDFGWGSKAFAKMGRLKIRLIATFLRLGVTPVISDVDVAWLRDPLPVFRLYPTADVLTSSDHLLATTSYGDDASLESWPEAGSAFNIGAMVFRRGSLRFVEEWIDVIERDLSVWDQNAFNDLARRGKLAPLAEGDAALDLPAASAESVAAAGAALAAEARANPLPKVSKNVSDTTARAVYGAGAEGADPVAAHRRRAARLFRCDEGRLVCGVLSVAAFANGHTFYVQRLNERQGVRPFAVHDTFVFSGTDGKRHRMRERAIWLDDDLYYRPKGGFLAFDLDLPKDLLKQAGPRTGKADLANAEGHFKLVNHQLAQVRAAMALATALNRTLVLPEFWCGLDRWWAPHAGTIPGSQFPLPFRCPADHILDLEGGLAAKHLDANPAEFGPPIAFREHSIFSNPRLPAASLGSTVYVDACKPGTTGCSDGQNPATAEYNRIRVAERLPSDRLLASLSSVEPLMTLRVTDVRRLWGGFSDAEQGRRFARRTAHYGGVWCCADEHPGHVHYDLWWDEEHTDKFGRKWGKGEWVPKTGP